MAFEIKHGDCLEVMRGMADNSVDAIVTDPPYGLSFMGKKWDYDVPAVEVWAECLRVLKPGGHLLAFAGTRTQHRMAVRIEDAGFEIRDMIAWVYGSGFPKSRNVCLDMDKMDGHGNRGHRIAVANRHHPDGTLEPNGEHLPAYEPKTDAAKQWQGWGTALKPSHEPLTFARKPLDLRAHCIYLAQYLTSQLCQYSASVKDAGPSSMSSPSASGAAMSGSALWTAVGRCNTPGDLFALMDTLPSGSVLPSTLSTVFSWLRTLDGLLQHESTFTTETASSLTTDLKTLNSLLLRSTQGITIAELTEPSGHGSSAELVACIFNGFDASLRSTLARFAHGNAIAKAQEHYLDAGVSPAMEPITMARKPLVGTVAANVMEHGTGAINVDGCRVGTDGATKRGGQAEYPKNEDGTEDRSGSWARVGHSIEPLNLGRWPANLIHDGSEEVVAGFPESKDGVAVRHVSGGKNCHSDAIKPAMPDMGYGGRGSAARFFYCAKASKSDRGEGNNHPTVKPTQLMRYLVLLVTQPGGTVLDPFMGSGSTGKAAILEGFSFIGIEKEEASVDISTRRMKEAQIEMGLFA